MQRGRPAGEVAEVLILKALYEKDLRFEELVNSLRDQLARGTINKYLNKLFNEGLIRRKGRRGPYYIPKEKRHEVKAILDRENLKQRIDKATQEEIEALKRKLEETEIELKYYKILEQIRELEEIPLPEKAVRKILENKIGEIAQKIPLNDVSSNVELNSVGPMHIIIKEVSLDEYERQYMFDRRWKRLQIFIENRKRIKFGDIETIKFEGKVFIGTYKKLLELYGELEKLEKLRKEI